ncbi:MAG: ferritin [Bacillota bacterium]|nr:ferritin [Bacillota bacterium]
MLDRKVKDLLNAQITAEFYSAYLYLDFSNYYKDAGLDGYANWYMVQAQEERDHAMLFIRYLQQQGESVSLETIDKPDKEYKAFIDPLKMGAEHERVVTGLINDIYAEAFKVKDFRTMQFLDWFIKEQAEEEDSADDNITKFELFGSDSKSLYELDADMKARTYAPPSLVLD